MTSAYPNSYYAATAKKTAPLVRLDGDMSCDVCIIGAGYTGLSAALHLAEQGYRPIVLEAERIGWGASGRNGGQLGTTLRKSQDELEALYGLETTHALWDLAKDSVDTVKDLIERYEIECDLTPGLLHAAWKRRDADWLEEDVHHMREEYGYHKLRYISRGEMREMVASECYHGGALDQGGAHLHPLNYALGLARAATEKGATIFEESRVLELTPGEPVLVRTETGTVKADQVVIACNGYLGKLLPDVNGYIMPINNFIIATEPLGEEGARALIRDNVAVADTKFVIDYYRLSEDGRLLFGGGENYSPKFPKDIAAFVKKPMLRVFPQLKDVRIDYAWGGTLAITLSRMPQFGRLGPNMLFAHGYSGQGINVATLGGKLIAETINGDAKGFDLLSQLPATKFPGGTLLRFPGLVAGMLFYAMKDRLP